MEETELRRIRRLREVLDAIFKRTEVLRFCTRVKRCDERFKIEKTEYFVPFRTARDMIPGIGKNLKEVRDALEHLQIGLSVNAVLKRIEPGKIRGMRRTRRRRGDEELLGEDEVFRQELELGCIEGWIGAAERVKPPTID